MHIEKVTIRHVGVWTGAKHLTVVESLLRLFPLHTSRPPAPRSLGRPLRDSFTTRRVADQAHLPWFSTLAMCTHGARMQAGAMPLLPLSSYRCPQPPPASRRSRDAAARRRLAGRRPEQRLCQPPPCSQRGTGAPGQPIRRSSRPHERQQHAGASHGRELQSSGCRSDICEDMATIAALRQRRAALGPFTGHVVTAGGMSENLARDYGQSAIYQCCLSSPSRRRHPPGLAPAPPPPFPPGVFPNRAALLVARDAWCADPTAAAAIYGPIRLWDISQVTDLSYVFCALSARGPRTAAATRPAAASTAILAAGT